MENWKMENSTTTLAEIPDWRCQMVEDEHQQKREISYGDVVVTGLPFT